ncbi:GAF domain-containing protein, partial [bacterium]|nr:GAF domain-containing protein [bacterium]
VFLLGSNYILRKKYITVIRSTIIISSILLIIFLSFILRRITKNRKIINIEKEKFRNLFYGAPIGVVLLDKKLKLINVNNMVLKLTQFTENYLIGKKTGSLFEKKAEIKSFRKKISNILKGISSEFFFETTILRKNGEKRICNLCAKMISSELVMVTIDDITEKKQLELEQIKLTQQIKVLSEVNQAIIRIKTRRELLERICQIAVEIGGFCMSWIGFLDEKTNKVIPEAYYGKTLDYLENLNIDLNDEKKGNGPTGIAIKTGEHYIVNDFEQDKNMTPWRQAGRKMCFKSSAAFPITVFGKTIGTINLYSSKINYFSENTIKIKDEMAGDVSFALENMEKEEEKKRLEKIFNENNKKLNTTYKQLTYTLETMSDAFVQLDKHWIYTYVNKKAGELFGKDPRTLVGKHIWTEFPEGIGQPFYKNYYKAMETQIPINMKEYYPPWNKWYENRIVPSPDGLVIFFRDVTHEKQLEEEREKRYKLQSLSLLAGGIAHDFNNYLAEININIHLAIDFIKNKTESIKYLKKVNTILQNSSRLSNRLLSFSKDENPSLMIVRTEDYIRNEVQLYLSGSNMKAKYLFKKGLFNVEIDVGQISQVLENLVLNSKQAMNKGGTITIDTKNKILKENNIYGIEKGKYIEIKFSDTGKGISNDCIKKIFDPYFTTKAKGNGLGLSIVYSIIQKHKGYIGVESKINKGTTFTVLLPATDKKIIKVKEKKNNKIKKSGKQKRILVLDDEKMMRDSLKMLLTTKNYIVETCETGETAIKLFKNASKGNNPFDLLIFDITLPGGISGKEAYIQIKKIDPKIRVIFSSGYSEEVLDMKDKNIICFLKKPFDVKKLFEIIEDL